MAIESWEFIESGTTEESESSTSEQVWVIKGTADRLAARNELYNKTVDIEDGLWRQSWRVEPLADELWMGYVQYGLAQPVFPGGDSAFTFETGGGTQHIESSLKTQEVYPQSGLAKPETNRLIGNTPEGIEGADIALRVFNWTEKFVLPTSQINQAYIDLLYWMTGTINTAPWRNRAAGEVLFNGVAGGQRGFEAWELTFSFSASPNFTGLEVGPVSAPIGGINKRGWDYLWIMYENQVDDTAWQHVKIPRAVFVEQVYEETDFLLLGIGA